MRKNSTLNSIKKATLMALFEETGFSIHAHVSLNSIQRHFPKALRGFCRDALKDLVRQGYVTKHPTAGSMTYSLTNEGVNAIKEMLSHNRQVLEK